MDFFGLLNEYGDSQGATVRVREPGRSSINSKSKPVKSGLTVKSVEPEQMKLDLEPVDEQIKVIGAGSKDRSVKVKDATPFEVTEEKIKVSGGTTVKDATPEKIATSTETVATEEKEKPVKEPVTSEEMLVKEPVVIEEKAKEEPSAIEDTPIEVPVMGEETKAEVTEVVLPKKTSKKKIATEEVKTDSAKEVLFKQCKRCWCFDCKHNSRNEGVPREMCGTMIPCPACDGCVQEDMATICEIGNAKEGCGLRAREEGIVVDEEVF